MQTGTSEILLFSGSSHPELAKEVAALAGVRQGRAEVEHFPDGEIAFRLLEEVRGKQVFVLQTVALKPNEYMVELLVMIDALKRASACSITPIIPYFGYARQDHRAREGEPITARLMADLLVKAGATHILTMDLHSGQIEGFFDVPVDNIPARPCLVEALKRQGVENFVVVGPDLGSIRLVRALAGDLGLDFAVVDKHRYTAKEVEVINIIGEVKGRDVLLADDMCSTGGTLVSAAKACREKGANRVCAIVTHGLFVDEAIEKIGESPIECLFVTNTIPFAGESPKLRTISVAPLFSRALRN